MAVTKIGAADLPDWAAEEEFLPYAWYADFKRDACRDYRAAQLAQTAASACHHAFRFEDPTGVAAFGITTLGWDTEQFGIPAGRVDYLCTSRSERTARRHLNEAAAAACVAEAERLGVRHLSARFDGRDFLAIQAMEKAGFQLVDGILRFSLTASEFTPQPSPPGVVIREATANDIPALAALAARGFTYDRFHNDPHLAGGIADRVHAAWLENAVKGGTGSGVLCAEVDGKPGGFFILSLDTLAGQYFGGAIGTLVLITVDGALRRRGVAMALSLGSVAWLRERGAVKFEVGTQLANVPAANVYLKSGFRLVQTSVSLRRMA